jgi:LPS sulfotransferase NodH
MLISQMRSGSNVLRNIVRQGDGIVDAGEVFHPEESRFKDARRFYQFQAKFVRVEPNFILPARRQALWPAFLQHLESVASPRKIGERRILLIDVKYFMLNALDDWATLPSTRPWLLGDMIGRGGLIIHLTRRDLVRQIISRLMAEATHQWSRKAHDAPMVRKLTVDTTAFRNRYIEYQNERRAVADMLQSYPHCSAQFYEDLFPLDQFPSQPPAWRELGDFLGTDLAKIKPTLEKQGTYEIADVVNNYDEFAECLQRLPAERKEAVLF